MLKLLKYNYFSTVFHLQHVQYHNLRIGCASGFWGDTATAVPQLIQKGKLDFLVFDYLSEITMSLLAKAKSRDSRMGYTPDFINIARYANELKKQGIKVIANAGGLNPDGCCYEMNKALEKSGVQMKIAVVKGDDLMSNKDAIQYLQSMDHAELPDKSFFSSDVYFGATPICFALDQGADMVITGRCVDSALTLGPLMHHFKWSVSDLDKLAAGSLAGHLLECGAQSTGGIFTDWQTVPNWWNIGFPIVEVEESGKFIITKPEDTGGLVSSNTVGEQLVYEIGDPASYVLPDVICDFTNVTMTEIGKDIVEVHGAKGYPPPENYKVSSTYVDKFRLSTACVIVGKDAVAKGRSTAENIMKRVRAIMKSLNLPDFTRSNISIIGGEDSYGSSRNHQLIENVREAVIYIAAEHTDQVPLKILSAEFAPAGTNMSPGLTLLIAGRPKVTPIIKHHSSLISKEKIKATVKINSEEFVLSSDYVKHEIPRSKNISKEYTIQKSNLDTTKTYVLRDLAFARSGDKGNICNIGVISRNENAWEIIRERLTVDVVGSYFNHFFPNCDYRGHVSRFDLPGIKAVNFVLENVLDGGGISSLRFDNQGKCFGQILLDIKF